MLDIRVVVVEDDIQLLETSSRILAREIKEVISFSEPSKALSYLDTNKPDILITDIKMPNIGGLELVKIVKYIYPELPVIIMSAFSEPDYFMKAINLKVNHFLTKPIDIEKLLELIHEIAKDLEVKKELEKQKNLLNQYKKIVDVSNNIVITDKSGRIKYVNDKFCGLCGYSKEELIGQPQNIMRHPDMPSSFFKKLWGTILDKKVWKGIIKNLKKDGSSFYVETTISPFLNEKEEIEEFISIKTDVTSLMLKKEELKKEIVTDRLTGLPNRIKLQDDLKNTKDATLIVFDINHFKEVNLLFGVEMGDEALIYLSKTIQNLMQKNESSTLYRISADQFTLYKEKDATQEFEEFANVLHEFIDKESFNYKDISFDIDFTCGIAHKNKDEINLLEGALDALDTAKKRKHFLQIYDERTSKQSEYEANFEWTKKIKKALQEGRIKSYFQALYDIKNNSIKKYESLVRFIEEDGTVISPYMFLDIAKRSTLYAALTKTVITQACETFANREENVTINFSIEDLMDPETIEFFIQTVKDNKMQNRVTAEVLESEGVENFEVFQKTLLHLKENNIDVAIDDFGSGYSNFSYLINLDIDILKIDGSLIKNINFDKNSQIIVKSIVNFANELGMQTVAEFVCDEDVYKKVKELGVDFAQGYYISEPIDSPLDEDLHIEI